MALQHVQRANTDKPHEQPVRRPPPTSTPMPITTCDSPETLRAEVDTVRKKITLDETEDTWDKIAQGILHLTRLSNNGGSDFPSEMVAGVRSMSRPLNSALNSERSKLSGAAIELLTTLATDLGPSFEPLVSIFIPNLLALCARTNKVFTSRARACIIAIVQQTRLPSLLPYIAELASHKSVFPRLTAAEAVLACLNCFNPPDLEKETRARVVEDFIKSTARDASADVRKTSKEVFKAYKLLMPARVDSFVAPLTPVVKKYLDIQTTSIGVSSNAREKQASRPSSRTNNKAMGTRQQPASSTLSKPPTRVAADEPAHSMRQRQAISIPPATTGTCLPRQRTTSQMQRDAPRPRNFHIDAQSSTSAQRCVVPPPAPSLQSVRHPLPGAVRVPPSRNASSTGCSTGGPQRPPPMQIKFNTTDRHKVSGSGARRIPLPSVPVNGTDSEQPTVTGNSVDRAGSGVDKPRSRLPSRKVEAVAPENLAVGRKALEGTRSAPLPSKLNSRSAAGSAAVQPSHKRSVKGDPRKPRGAASQQRSTANEHKGTRPIANDEQKQTSPSLVPLPPSPSASPTEVPLPPSPDCTPHNVSLEARDERAAGIVAGPTDPAGNQVLGSVVHCQEMGDMGNPSTPITTLLSSIQRGFLFTPSSPLSPPQNYLTIPPCSFAEKTQDKKTVGECTKGPSAGAAFCISVEDDSVADGLDRHALKDLN